MKVKYILETAYLYKMNNGKKTYIPANELVYEPLIFIPDQRKQDPFDLAMKMRCDLMKDPVFNDRYIRIVEYQG